MEYFDPDAMPVVSPDGKLPDCIPATVSSAHASALAALHFIAHPEIGGQRGLWWCRAAAASELVKQLREAAKEAGA